MDLYSYLETNYDNLIPIFLSELKEKEGVYYIPEKTQFGILSMPFEYYIYRKYISNGEEKFGIYDHLTLLNMMGLCTQMPFVIEVLTNKISAKKE